MMYEVPQCRPPPINWVSFTTSIIYDVRQERHSTESPPPLLVLHSSTPQLRLCSFIYIATLFKTTHNHNSQNSHINFISNNRKAAGQLLSQFTYENPCVHVVHVCAHAFLFVWRPTASAESNYTLKLGDNSARAATQARDLNDNFGCKIMFFEKAFSSTCIILPADQPIK